KLTPISAAAIEDWKKYQAEKARQRCYVITREGVEYRDGAPGIDQVTGRACRALTDQLRERLREYENGNRPQKIQSNDPTFFDSRTAEPIVWFYQNKSGDIELFDLIGFHPETGEELRPVTKEIVEVWKRQAAERKLQNSRRAPQRIDPERANFFDPLTGKPRVWYGRTPGGDYEFYDGDGYDPSTGEKLTPVSAAAIEGWKKYQTEKAKQRCYVITRDGVEYRDGAPGIDQVTGRECRALTDQLRERLGQYGKGN